MSPLPKLDILGYVPVERFVPEAASWDDLREQMERETGQQGDLKGWLRTPRPGSVKSFSAWRKRVAPS